MYFDHERLDVYRVSIEFVRWTGDLIERTKSTAGIDHATDR